VVKFGDPLMWPYLLGSGGLVGLGSLILNLIQWWLGRKQKLAGAPQRVAELERTAAELHDQLDFSNQRLKVFSAVLERVARLPGLDPSHLEDELHDTLLMLLGLLAQLFSAEPPEGYNLFRLAILTPGGDGALGVYLDYGYSDRARESLKPQPSSAAEACRRTGLLQYVPDRTQDGRFADDAAEAQAYRTRLCLPVFVKGSCHGVLNIEGVKEDSLSEDDRDVGRFASLIIQLCLALSVPAA